MNLCPKCNKPYIQIEIVSGMINYTHAPIAKIGGFGLVEMCLSIFPNEAELRRLMTASRDLSDEEM